jgi:hypothetical protein
MKEIKEIKLKKFKNIIINIFFNKIKVKNDEKYHQIIKYIKLFSMSVLIFSSVSSNAPLS